MPLATFLLSLVQPLIIQALIALGVGVLTVSGVDLAMNQALSWLTTAVGGLPANVASVLAMAGVFTGMSYILGAFAARIAIAGASSAFKRFFIQ